MPDDLRIARHATLVDWMATSQGVDLEEAILRGALTEEARTDAVLSCTNCTNPGDCEGWLAAQSGAPAASSPPGYCRNTGLFATLKAELDR